MTSFHKKTLTLSQQWFLGTRNKFIDVVLVSLLLTFNIFHTMFLCICCWLRTTNYQPGYFFQVSCALRVLSVRRSILFNIVRNWNQKKLKSCTVKASAFGWFLVILTGVGWFWEISDYFMIYTIYMISFSNYIRTI